MAPRQRLGEPLPKYLARVTDIISLVQGTQELADITYAYGAWRLGRVPSPRVLSLLSNSAQKTLHEILDCHDHRQLMALTPDAKTALLAHLVASALAVKRFPETASHKRVSGLSARWELLRGGNPNLWNALGMILQEVRSLSLGKKPETSPIRRKAGEPRQHFRCYRCKVVCKSSTYPALTTASGWVEPK
jgi:hypothetical protein